MYPNFHILSFLPLLVFYLLSHDDQTASLFICLSFVSFPNLCRQGGTEKFLALSTSQNLTNFQDFILRMSWSENILARPHMYIDYFFLSPGFVFIFLTFLCSFTPSFSLTFSIIMYVSWPESLHVLT